MSPAVALSFILLGAALWLHHHTRRDWLIQLAALMAMGIALLAFAGYLYGITELYGVAAYSFVALHTAIALYIAGIGVLFLRPDSGLMASITAPTPGGLLARRLLPAVIIIPLALSWARLWGQRQGFYNTEFGLALFALSNITIFALLVWRSARLLDQSENRYQNTLDNLMESCQIIGFDWRYRYINDAGARYGRVAKADLIGHTVMGKYPGIETTGMFADMRRCMEERISLRREYEFTYPDGSAAWFEFSIQPVPEGIFILALDITSRRQSQAELARLVEARTAELKARQEQLRFHAGLQAAVTDAVIATDLDFRIQSWNAAAERLYGWSAGEAIGRTITEILRPQIGPEESERIRAAFLEQGYWHGEFVHLRKDGSPVQIVGSTSLLHDESGAPAGIVSVNRDITESKRAAEALLESESILRAIVDTTADAIISIDADANIVAYNAAATRIFGYTAEEVIGQNIKMLMPPETAALHDGYVSRRKRTKETKIIGVQREELGLRKDGTVFPIFLAINESVVGGRVIYTGLIRDVTESKRIEKERDELYQQTQNALAAAQAYAVRLDSLNAMSQRINTAANEEEIYKSAVEYITRILPVDQFNIQLASPRANGPMTRRQAYRDVKVERAPDGEIVSDFRLVDTPAAVPNLQGAGGTTLAVPIQVGQFAAGVITVTSPDAHVYTSEDETILLHVASFLGIAIANMLRSHELQQAILVAEKASRAKSDFLATMSHELRTPLNAILGYVQILQRDKGLNARQRENLEIIHRSGSHLLSLINDILDLSKIEAQRMELSAEPFILDEMLASVCELARVHAEQKGLLFQYEALSDLPPAVRGDELRLRQALLNLLNNAIKYTEHGGIAFQVGHHEGRLRFQVEDTGIGIPPETLKRIFEPFAQGSQRAAEGTGLGLAITSQLIALMGGMLRVRSQPGVGSTFWFDLDLPVVENFVPLPRAPEDDITGYSGRRRRIMVVDDRAENRAILRQMLEPLGFEILEAVNGQDCLNKTGPYQPDAILMDARMPVMNGLEATRRLRQMSNPCVIIAISASAFEHNRAECLSAGANDFLAKPFRLPQLLDLLGHHLQLEWMIEPAGDEAPPPASSSLPVLPPPRGDLDSLYDLAMQGDVRGIINQAERLRRGGYAPFADVLLALANGFKIKELRQFIAQYRE
jgi:PAS domain S-box-containing protein